MSSVAVEEDIDRLAARLEAVLAQALQGASAPDPLDEVMRTAVLGGGKRFRPYLVAEVHSLLGGAPSVALQVGAAVELLHAASLALDDLPAMDDAELRRERPALHRRFGEGQTILAATSLIARAFALLSSPDLEAPPEVRAELVSACARAVGASGIGGGQALDLAGEQGRPHKTADLIAFCCESGAIVAGSEPAVRQLLWDFGANLGLAFQSRDDVLDGDAPPASGAASEARRLAVRIQARLESQPGVAERLAAVVDWACTRSR